MKAKSIFITTLLSLFVVGGLFAQDKYEYATLRPSTSFTSFVFTTSDNQEVIPSKVREIEKDLVKKVNELSDKGWEVYNTTEATAQGVTTYYLRKKKN